MKVELIYDADCPNVDKARANLLRAFAEAGVEARWTEWDRASSDGPAYVRRFGSPSILVDGRDVVRDDVPHEASCRLYRDASGAILGAPPIQAIARALADGAPVRHGSNWRRAAAAAPAFGVALIPKLTCAACWPAYAAFASAAGIGFFDYTAYLLPITVAAVTVALVSLGWRGSMRHGYGPFLLGVLGALIHLLGKFAFDANAAAHAGITLLVVATLWNIWPKRQFAEACNTCA